MAAEEPDTTKPVDRPAPASGSRPVTILDIGILIAAIALGLAVDRSESYFKAHLVWTHYSPWSLFQVWFRIAAIEATPFLFFFSVAIVAMACNCRRNERAEVLSQPGVSACSLVVIATLFLMCVDPVRLHLYGPYIPQEESQWLNAACHGIDAMSTLAGYFVAAMWVFQFAVGPAGGRTGWIDKFGRVVGVSWLVMLLAPPQ